MQEPRTAHAGPSPAPGEAAVPGAPAPRAADSTSPQQGWENNQGFFVSQLFLPCFKAEGYLGLISCNIALSISSHGGITTTFNSGFNSSYR